MDFNLRIYLHFTGIFISLCLLAWCLANTQYYATILTLTLITLLQIIVMLRYITSTNARLSRFLLAIRHSDFSQTFSHRGLGSSFRDLGKAFDAVIERFKNERSEKELQASYLQTFVQQVPIAICSIDESGRILLSNTAFRRITGVRSADSVNTITSALPALGRFLKNIAPGNDYSLKVSKDDELLQLKLSCTILRTQGTQQKLITIQDIRGELEARELEAWQNLIRVMTHEIMNSITPISSLAETTDQYLAEVTERISHLEQHPVDKEILALLEDSESAVQTIGNRSQGLMRFVESYRTLTRLPTPQIKTFRLSDLFNSVKALMQEQAGTQNIKIRYECRPETLEISADPELLEQALINLIRNALEAVTEVAEPLITVSAELRERGRVSISVRDNGSGITPENLENIFIPFFTTKRGGSGIGMSIVRQIARLNGGRIHVDSVPDQGTSIILNF